MGCERYQVEARWVVGCDGLHSAVRELSGIGFEGDALAKEWAVFDTSVQGWAESFEGTFVYLDDPGVVLTALPGHRWRVYLRPRSEESDLIADGASTLRAYAPSASFVDVENPARFHCHTKIASQYRSGAAFLAGDAAHVCSPSQGHGMNCGLQDAFNLAWKLALVHHGAAQPSLLDSYEKERRAAAELVTQSGDETERAFMTTDSVERESRNQAIQAMIADPKTRHHEVVAEAELNIDYSGSPIVLGDADGHLSPGIGCRIRSRSYMRTRRPAGFTKLPSARDILFCCWTERRRTSRRLSSCTLPCRSLAPTHLCLKQHSRLAAILICLRISGGSIRLELIFSD